MNEHKPNLKLMAKSTQGLRDPGEHHTSYPVLVDDSLTQKVKKLTTFGDLVEVNQYLEIFEPCWGDGESEIPYFLFVNEKYAQYILECQEKAKKYDEAVEQGKLNV